MTDIIASKADNVKKVTAKTALLYQELHESQNRYGSGSTKILPNLIPILKVYKPIKSQLDLGRKVIFTSNNDAQIVKHMLGITNTPPTIGLMMLAKVKYYNKNFFSDSIYGFSFKNPVALRHHNPHHYFSQKLLLRSTHDYENEKQIIERLFK